ncbi:MAG: AmmeMemoRadiSam system protein B [Verrucomicrobia bacterium]|nr:AmmeMemoRadiSam system protein B [Verrucomicrobiota bacterium]
MKNRTRKFGLAGIGVLVLSGGIHVAPTSWGKDPDRIAAGSTVLPPALEEKSPSSGGIRPPAVAGLFYPDKKESLAATVSNLFKAGPVVPLENLRALVCPHAGYSYSGPTAAAGYKQVIDRDFRRVIILAASHYAIFEGASLPDVSAYETPLGLVKLSGQAKTLSQKPPFVRRPTCRMQRPEWWRQSPAAAVAESADESPHTWEHSEEVHLPFLQTALRSFEIIPILFGRVDPRKVAEGIAELSDNKTLVVASSDLSHYHSYDAAQQLDRTCVRAIVALDIPAMEQQEACGKLPILALMHLARQKGWQTKLLDCRNSGDTAGDKSRVVGYTSVAFFDSNPVKPAPGSSVSDKPGQVYDAAERKFLMELARKTLTMAVSERVMPSVPKEKTPAKLTETRGCFVTLTKKGQLRGCIGHIFPEEPLYQAIMDNARNAALYDSRFSPVQTSELNDIEIEISVLTTPQPLSFKTPAELLARLRPHTDGVVLKIGNRGATYLPQVWKQLPDKERFLNSLAEKAGCAGEAWKAPSGVEALTYQVEAFHEERKSD